MYLLALDDFSGMYAMHNALLYRPPREALGEDESALSDSFLGRASAIDAMYAGEFDSGGSPAFFVDDVLSPAALEGLYDWCTDASVWFDVKLGYLGAYLDDGFTPPWLFRLVEDLRTALPNAVGDKVLGAPPSARTLRERPLAVDQG
ncbi:hypothetical protein M885DRAFT_268057 [Pelagophyceae sp. CCMP2097]|nr:hypothetical protein M885DRAFT_268057 [Pelagophyceae sp. CCMP2097]